MDIQFMYKGKQIEFTLFHNLQDNEEIDAQIGYWIKNTQNHTPESLSEFLVNEYKDALVHTKRDMQILAWIPTVEGAIC